MNIFKKALVINKIPETVYIDRPDIEARGLFKIDFPLRTDIKKIVGTYRRMVKESSLGLRLNSDMKIEICCGYDSDAEKMIYVVRCHHHVGREDDYIGKALCCYSQWRPTLIGGCWSYSVWLKLYKSQMMLSDYIKEINKYLKKYFPDVPMVTDNLLYSWILISKVCPDDIDEEYKKILMRDEDFGRALCLYEQFWEDHKELRKAIENKKAFGSTDAKQCIYIKGFLSK